MAKAMQGRPIEFSSSEYNSAVDAGQRFKETQNSFKAGEIQNNRADTLTQNVYNPGTALLYVNMAVEIDTFAPVYGETYPVKMSLNGSGAVGILTQPLASGQCGSMVTSGVVQVPVFGGTIKPYVRIENGGFWYDDRPYIPVMYGTTEWASINLGSAPAQAVANIAYFWELKTNTIIDEQTGTTQYYLYVNNPNKCYVQAFGERVSLVGAEALPIVAAEGYTGTIYLRWGAGKPELVVYVGDVPANCLHPCLELGLLNWNNGMPAITQTYVTTNSDIKLNDISGLTHLLAKPNTTENGIIIMPFKSDVSSQTFGGGSVDSSNSGKRIYAHLNITHTDTAELIFSSEFLYDSDTDIYVFVGVLGDSLGCDTDIIRFRERWYIV